MQIDAFEMFALVVCFSVFGVVFSLWGITNFVTDREIWLITALHVTLMFSIHAKQTYKSAMLTFLTRHTAAIETKQLADLQEAHRKHITMLKTENIILLQHIQNDLKRTKDDLAHVTGEYDWMTGTFHDQVRLTQEQEDRIAYLEAKLQEYGQMTPATRVPYSAPADVIRFENPPRRAAIDRTAFGMASTSLAQVVETAEE